MATLYVYALTCDSNFAPCFDNDMFSLACCKGGKNGGMRTSVRNAKERGEDVYVLGVCSKTLSKEATKNLNDIVDRDYKPIFFAKVDECVEYSDYYADNSVYKGRTDQRAYSVVKGEIVPNEECNPHFGNHEAIEKDIGGRYVLISKEFIYLGDKCGKLLTSIEKNHKYIFCTDTSDNEQKAGIDKHFRGYIIFEDFDCDVINQSMSEARKCINNIKPSHLSKKYIIDVDDDEKDVVICKCGGKK